MTLEDIKKISIREYLEQIGISPAKESVRYGMYHSPFREDRDASMKVDYNQNLWIDYGTGEGGSIIDLASRIEKCSIGEAIKKLNDKSFSFHGNNFVPAQQEPAIAITGIQPLTHPALLDYLEERGINTDIAKQYCSEVHYSITNKPYFAVGFQNDAGGWELRNRYFKGSYTPKNITTIQNGSNTVMAFEGFIDFLSYLSLKGNSSPAIDTTVLNSVTNLQKAIPFLQSHQAIYTFFDNDEAGRKSLASLRDQLKHAEIIDQSVFYGNYKDLNECWQDKSKSQKQLPETGAAIEIKRQIPIRKRGRSL
ncbi:toprim domain-containing protein [Parabacteroides sp. OttesenSCG-928-G07]|nr:toprim domain-containing protein [Parabacteroides sp. OttesenSCG-928-G21]MDL2277119.1 toprim domain-containing protein [Parabacteroides sp. OttesenSCG-928-G07]